VFDKYRTSKIAVRSYSTKTKFKIVTLKEVTAKIWWIGLNFQIIRRYHYYFVSFTDLGDQTYSTPVWCIVNTAV